MTTKKTYSTSVWSYYSPGWLSSYCAHHRRYTSYSGVLFPSVDLEILHFLLCKITVGLASGRIYFGLCFSSSATSSSATFVVVWRKARSVRMRKTLRRRMNACSAPISHFSLWRCRKIRATYFWNRRLETITISSSIFPKWLSRFALFVFELNHSRWSFWFHRKNKTWFSTNLKRF